MATLNDEQRWQMWAEYMREMSRRGITTSLLKAELRDALDALDDYVEANATLIDTTKGTEYLGDDLGKAELVAGGVTTGRVTTVRNAMPVAVRAKPAVQELNLMLAHVLKARDKEFVAAPEEKD